MNDGDSQGRRRSRPQDRPRHAAPKSRPSFGSRRPASARERRVGRRALGADGADSPGRAGPPERPPRPRHRAVRRSAGSSLRTPRPLEPRRRRRGRRGHPRPRPPAGVGADASSGARNRRRRPRPSSRTLHRPRARHRRAARAGPTSRPTASRANPSPPPLGGPAVPLALRTWTVPAKPRWLLSIPDAINQLEQLDRTPAYPARRRTACRRPGRRRCRARRQPEDAPADEAPAGAQEALPRPGPRSASRRETRAFGCPPRP